MNDLAWLAGLKAEHTPRPERNSVYDWFIPGLQCLSDYTMQRSHAELVVRVLRAFEIMQRCGWVPHRVAYYEHSKWIVFLHDGSPFTAVEPQPDAASALVAAEEWFVEREKAASAGPSS